MGLLDPKTRIMDTLLTEEGRLQLSRGKMQIAFAAFSDGATFYEFDSSSGSSDATNRIYLEATNLPQDQITFQADDSGRLKPFKNPTGLNVISGQIVSGSSLVQSTNDQFTSMAGTILGSSIKNFKNLTLISTLDQLFEDDQFEVNTESVKFVLTDTNPLPKDRLDNVNVKSIPTFVEDPRMSHTLAFKYLPPVIRTNAEEKKVKLSKTTPMCSFNDESVFIDAYKARLSELEKNGAHQQVVMDPTSHDNNVMMQIFEVQPDNTLIKLDVLVFESKKKLGDAVHFIGKVIQDEDDFKFVNIFTMTMG